MAYELPLENVVKRRVTQPRVVFFDAAGTLIRLPKGPAHHYCEVAARHGLTLVEESVAQAFRAVWDEMPTPETTREPRDDDGRDWWRVLVNQVLERCGVRVSGGFDREAYFSELYEEFSRPGIWELYPEALSVLTRLHDQYELGIISNFDGRLRKVLQHLGIAGLFGTIVISTEVGAEKPDSWIFHQAVERSGVDPGEAIHVGDHPVADWEGAAAAGLQVFRLERPRTTLDHLADRLR